MRKLITSFISSVLLCFVVALSACGNSGVSGELSFSVQYASNSSWESGKTYPSVCTVRTTHEMETYCRGNNINSITYDADFFADHFVVVIEMETTNGAESYRVTKAISENNQLTVYTTRGTHGAGPDVMGEYFAFIEFESGVSVKEKAIKVEIEK